MRALRSLSANEGSVPRHRHGGVGRDTCGGADWMLRMRWQSAVRGRRTSSMPGIRIRAVDTVDR